MITAYLNVEAYAEFHRWLGRGPALQPMWDAWAAGDRKAALAAIPDEVVDDLVVHGSLERVPGPHRALHGQRHHRAGPGRHPHRRRPGRGGGRPLALGRHSRHSRRRAVGRRHAHLMDFRSTTVADLARRSAAAPSAPGS